MNDNIINFNPKQRDSIKYKRRAYECQHWDLEIDEESRMVECKKCGKMLDPVTVLIQFAMLERKLDYSRWELKELSSRISELKHEEKLIKARIRNAKKRAEK